MKVLYGNFHHVKIGLVGLIALIGILPTFGGEWIESLFSIQDQEKYLQLQIDELGLVGAHRLPPFLYNGNEWYHEYVAHLAKEHRPTNASEQLKVVSRLNDSSRLVSYFAILALNYSFEFPHLIQRERIWVDEAYKSKIELKLLQTLAEVRH